LTRAQVKVQSLKSKVQSSPPILFCRKKAQKAQNPFSILRLLRLLAANSVFQSGALFVICPREHH
jgi:hypothetical protein